MQVSNPYQHFFDTDGTPLDNGSIYVGLVGLDAESNPQAAYFDKALTIPATQPIATLNGYPVRAGSPAEIYVSGSSHSITVRNSSGEHVYSATNVTDDVLNSIELSSFAASAGYSNADSSLDADTIQAAIDELDSEKVSKSGDTMSGSLGLPMDQEGANARRADQLIWKVGGAARMPSWATADRPVSPSNGDVGNNTTIGSLEVWNGSAWNHVRISSGTNVALTGTAVDISGIPSWASWVAIDFFDASTSATADMLIQLGTSLGVESTGYKTSAAYSGGSATTAATTNADGFVFRSLEPALSCSGVLTIKKATTNKYSGSGTLGSNGAHLGYCGGGKELAGALDRIRILPRSGSFDGGTVSVTWGN